MPEQRFLDYGDFDETATGFSYASGDRVWHLLTWLDPEDPVGQAHLHLCRDGDEQPWACSYDPMEGETPVFGSLREARAFLASEGDDLPGGRARWMPITVGDRWRMSEGKPLRRQTSKRTAAIIKAVARKR